MPRCPLNGRYRGEKRTSRGSPISVAIDPSQTLRRRLRSAKLPLIGARPISRSRNLPESARDVAARAPAASRVRWEETMFRLLGFLFVLCVVGQPSFGDDNHKVLGTWKLVSYETEVQATGEKEPAMGQSP